MKYKVIGLTEAKTLGFDIDLMYGDEYNSGVFEMKDGKPIRLLGQDGGEPEDQRLYRDWSWVVDALNEAYEKGLHDR